MNFLKFFILLIISCNCSAGPLEDLANMPDLTLFYQQLMRQQDLQMFLQGFYTPQQPGSVNDLTIFAPTNEAMTRLNRRNEDLNILWKYHVVPGRYDEQILANMAQEKFNQVYPRQILGNSIQNNIPTLALPFQVFYGLGFYGGTGPQVNETYENAGYGSGGISWLTQTSVNYTNLHETHHPTNTFPMNNYSPNQNYVVPQGNLQSNNNPQNSTNYRNMFNPQMNAQFLPNMNYNSYLQQQPYGPVGPNGGIGILRPTINNAFILQSRPMSRGVINVIDHILWPPERRDQTQYKTAYDILEDAQFSRLRQLADRSDYLRSELRSMHHQTWFLPNDQAFAGIGSSLSFLLDQSSMNNTNDINEFIRSHVLPLVLFPTTMDSTKQITTLSQNKWMTFRKISQPDQSFQIDVISGRHVARILISRPEEIRFYGNGIVYPISAILSTQIRTAGDEISRNYQYFMTLVQQSGDMELLNILQGGMNQNSYAPQNLFNITVLIPQQASIQQLGNAQELSMNLRRHILRVPVYTDQLMPMQRIVPNSFSQSNVYRTGQQQQQQQQQPSNPQQNTYQTGQQQQQPMIPQQTMYQTGQQQPQQQQPINPQQNIYQTGQQQQQQPLNPQQNIYQTGQQQQQQQPINPQQNIYQTGQQQQPLIPQQNTYQTGQQQQQQQNMYQTIQPQQPFIQPGYNQQQFQIPQFQRGADKKQVRRRRQMTMAPITNFQPQQFPQQQMPPIQQQPLLNQPLLPTQQQPFDPNYNQMAQFPSGTTFQNGQVYPTLDPQFSVQAQVASGPNGNLVTLIGRSTNSLPFTATILNSESNIPIKNGIMHVIRGILSGTIMPLEGVLGQVQGTNIFAQLLQQTGVFNQIRQSGRPHTLFIPTNAALQSTTVSSDINRLRQFVLRHICADVLLDPTNNVLRRSAGFYSRGHNSQLRQQQRSRQKRQDWMNNQQNLTNRQGFQVPPNLGPGYFQPQQQVYGGYPAAPTSFGSNNQLYNPSYPSPSLNGTYMNNQNFNYNNFGNPNQPMMNMPWNQTMNTPFNPQINAGSNNPTQNFAPNSNNDYFTGSTYTKGPQTCVAMTGERISVQSLGGTQPEGNTISMSYQNFMVTCCGDPSVASLVQSFNSYPPNFAVYLISRSLLSQGQTVNNIYNSAIKQASFSYFILFLFILLIIFKEQIHRI